MENFLINHWDECLAIIAILVVLVPPAISAFLNAFGKLHCVFLDNHLVYNATGNIVKGTKRTIATGCILILALNIFIYQKTFFPYKITCKIKLKNGSKIYAPMFEGDIGYSDTNTPPNYHKFIFDEKHNMNTNRVIMSNKDNLRIIPFFLTDINLQNLENVEKISIRLKGRILSKRIILNPENCVKNLFIAKYDIIQ